MAEEFRFGRGVSNGTDILIFIFEHVHDHGHFRAEIIISDNSVSRPDYITILSLVPVTTAKCKLITLPHVTRVHNYYVLQYA